jgi:hypothetical protein
MLLGLQDARSLDLETQVAALWLCRFPLFSLDGRIAEKCRSGVLSHQLEASAAANKKSP